MKWKIQSYKTLASTNETARQEAMRGAVEGTVITAVEQNGGKGRLQRKWFSPAGGLWFSMILKPRIKSEKMAQLTLLTAVAVTKTLRELYETHYIRIKWPNDILFSGKKICGILSEGVLDEKGEIDYVIIGVGLNLNLTQNQFSDELRHLATSLYGETHKKYTVEKVLDEILVTFAELYEVFCQQGSQSIFDLWKKYNCTLTENVLVKDNDMILAKGIAKDIDENGALIVLTEDRQLQKYDFGEISVRTI